MPVTLSYPGVYVQEVPSGVRTLTGVPTAIAAFVGRAARGPLNTATPITSYADYERTFGGLHPDSTMSFAVRDFFLNGGGQAVVVRLYRASEEGGNPVAHEAQTTQVVVGTAPEPAVADPPAATVFTGGDLTFEAASPGVWGRALRVEVDTLVPDGLAASLGIADDKIFNLSVVDELSGRAERFSNLTVEDHPNRVDRVLERRSELLRWAGADPTDALQVEAGKDEVSARQDALKRAREAADYSPAQVTLRMTEIQTALDALTGGDGDDLTIVDELAPAGAEANKEGLYALEQADLFNLLCIAPCTGDPTLPPQLVGLAAAYCERKRAFLVLDAPDDWTTPAQAVTGMGATPDEVGTRSMNAALYWPRLRQPNPFNGGLLEDFSAVGAVAGVMARTDAERGVWKAPAGLDAVLKGVPDVSYRLTDGEQGLLNPLGLNALRVKAPAGRVVYGARTLQGDDRLASEYKYVPVRRLALFLEESLYRGTQWAVFEPNDEPLWSQIRLNLGTFMADLFRKGAFQGRTPAEAYFVKCDGETTTQNDVNLGIVNVVVGFAPIKPAEFVVISFKQMAGRLAL